jgi:fibronectin type 3 domain-containing protein
VKGRFATCLSLVFCGCGYVGDTRAPTLKLPVPVTDLAVVERGDKLVIQFTVPMRTTDEVPLRQPPELVVYVDGKSYQHLPPPQGLLAHAEVDAKPFYGKDVRVAVVALNDHDKNAGLSNMVGLRVVPALALPANLKAVAVPEGIEVSWDSPEKSFTIFRQAPGEMKLTKLDTTDHSPYIDKNSEYDKPYLYAVQASSQSAQSEVAEMKEPIVPLDKFAPAMPRALAAVVGAQSVELVWDRDTEPDLAGYRIYRDSGSGQFERLGESHDTPSYSDKMVEKGRRYRYAVSAYDRAGNESKMSEPVEAFIP